MFLKEHHCITMEYQAFLHHNKRHQMFFLFTFLFLSLDLYSTTPNVKCFMLATLFSSSSFWILKCDDSTWSI